MAQDSPSVAHGVPISKDPSDRERLFRRGTKQAWAIVAAVLLPPIAWFAWGFTDMYLASEVEPRPFTSAEWKATSDSTFQGRQARHFMAEDLLATQRLEGTSRASIHDLLGDPNSGPLAKKGPPWTYTYLLNPQFGADDFWLLIRFDEGDRVEFAGIVGD